jgi:uncharacterized damage-inducible protein DinB
VSAPRPEPGAPLDPRVTPLRTTLRLNTRLLLNCLDGLSEEMGASRPNGRTNSIAFLAAHLVDVRHFLAGALGLALDNPFAAALGGASGIDEVAACPTLAAARAAWTEVGTALDAALATLAPAALDAPAPARFPVDDPTLLGEITFLMQHEGYHVGQAALIRKFLGAPAMVYR